MKIESPVQLAETAGQLNARPRPPMKLLVSLGTCGIAAGTQPVLKAIRDEITERRLENAIEVSEVGCMGLCYAEPVIMLLDRESGKRLIYGDVTPQQIPAILSAGTDAAAPGTRTLERCWYYPETETPAPGELQARIVLRNTGCINPETIAETLNVTSAAVCGMVENMVQRGLLTRNRCESNRRSVNISLSEHSKKKIREVEAAYTEIAERMCREIGAAEADRMIGILEGLTEKLVAEDPSSYQAQLLKHAK